MDDMLRQLLSMINAVPPPGRAQGSAVDPKVQQAQMQAEVTDLGRVGGMHQKDAQLPTGPMMDNGLGGQVPVPMTDLGRIGGDPAHAARMPNRPMVDNGRGSMVPAQNTQVSGVSMPPQYDTQMAGVSMPPQMNTQVTGVDMPRDPLAGLLERGNIDENNRPMVIHPGGDVSTVYSMTVPGRNGGYVNIPSVSEDGRMMDEREAEEQYRRTDRHLGEYDSVQTAEAAAQKTHESQAGKNTQRYRGTPGHDVGVGVPTIRRADKAPVHLHLNEDVLKALIKHKSKATAEDGEGE